MAHLAYACRASGVACEWALEADTLDVILQRAAEHNKCAHHEPTLSDEARQRISAAIRTV